MSRNKSTRCDSSWDKLIWREIIWNDVWCVKIVVAKVLSAWQIKLFYNNRFWFSRRNQVKCVSDFVVSYSIEDDRNCAVISLLKGNRWRNSWVGSNSRESKIIWRKDRWDQEVIATKTMNSSLCLEWKNLNLQVKKRQYELFTCKTRVEEKKILTNGERFRAMFIFEQHFYLYHFRLV